MAAKVDTLLVKRKCQDRFHSAGRYASVHDHVYIPKAGSNLGSMGDLSCCHLHLPHAVSNQTFSIYVVYLKVTRLDRCVFSWFTAFYHAGAISRLSRTLFFTPTSDMENSVYYVCTVQAASLHTTSETDQPDTQQYSLNGIETRRVLSLHLLAQSLWCRQGLCKTRTGMRTRGGDEPKSPRISLSYISRADHSSCTVAILTSGPSVLPSGCLFFLLLPIPPPPPSPPLLFSASYPPIVDPAEEREAAEPPKHFFSVQWSGSIVNRFLHCTHCGGTPIPPSWFSHAPASPGRHGSWTDSSKGG